MAIGSFQLGSSRGRFLQLNLNQRELLVSSYVVLPKSMSRFKQFSGVEPYQIFVWQSFSLQTVEITYFLIAKYLSNRKILISINHGV